MYIDKRRKGDLGPKVEQWAHLADLPNDALPRAADELGSMIDDLQRALEDRVSRAQPACLMQSMGYPTTLAVRRGWRAGFIDATLGFVSRFVEDVRRAVARGDLP